MSFKDHFSGHSPDYSAFRPHYPRRLFSELASLCASHELAWDCATGSGQAAIGLADHFDEVIATDASEAQIEHALPGEGVSYSVARAENSGIPAASIDLITVAQALHWFDLPAFTLEANRVLKANGVLAAWTYGVLTFRTGLDEIIERLYADIVGEFWPFERRIVEGGYTDIEMPFEQVPMADLEMTETWDLAALTGYLNTWSAVKACEKAHGRNPLELIEVDLLRQWGDPEAERVATWPLLSRVWRKTENR